MFKYLIIAVFCLSTNNSYTSNLQLNVKTSFGYPMATFSAGEVYKGENLTALIYIKPQINLNFKAYNVSTFIYFSTHLLSTFGLIPLAGSGIGAVFYPSGFPVVNNNPQLNTTLKYKKFAPYFGLASGISRMSISDVNTSTSFLSNTMDITAIAGLDYPIANSFATGFEISYASSFLGGTKNNSGSISNNTSFNFCITFSYYP